MRVFVFYNWNYTQLCDSAKKTPCFLLIFPNQPLPYYK